MPETLVRLLARPGVGPSFSSWCAWSPASDRKPWPAPDAFSYRPYAQLDGTSTKYSLSCGPFLIRVACCNDSLSYHLVHLGVTPKLPCRLPTSAPQCSPITSHMSIPNLPFPYPGEAEPKAAVCRIGSEVAATPSQELTPFFYLPAVRRTNDAAKASSSRHIYLAARISLP